VENALSASAIYTGWTCRFYVSQEVQDPVIRQLRDAGAEVARRQRRYEADGLFWRFFPASESGVDAVIVRDVDSRLSERERLAVEEWLDSGAAIHIMRDHPNHRNLIMGGMWGCRAGAIPSVRRLIWNWRWRRWRKGLPAFDRYGLDQLFLSEMVYPRCRHSACIHTDWVRFSGEAVRPFPLPWKPSGYVGERVSKDGTPTDQCQGYGEPVIADVALSDFAPGVI
jgi:hypothetical protein